MDTSRNRVSLILGALFVLAGLLLLVGQQLGFSGMGNFWPLIIVLVGAGFFIGMVMSGKQSGGLAIPGSIITMVGAILFFQNVLGWWETWSYAWALIIVAVGAGVWIDGAWTNQPELRSKGWRTMRAGLILFLVFGVLFEFLYSIVGISSHGSGLFWAVMMALLGLILLVIQLVRLARGEIPEGHTPNLFWPIFLFGVGCLAILASQNWLTRDNALRMVSLWPLLLVALGLYLILGRRYAWVGAGIAVLLVAAFLAVGLVGDRLGIQPASTFTLGDGINLPGISFNLSNQQIRGSGQVTEETRTVSGFDRVMLGTLGDIEITQGNSESLVISAESSLLPYITTTVQGGELAIRSKDGVNISPSSNRPIRYRLTVKNLSAVQLAGMGDVAINPLTTKDLQLRLAGMGDFNVPSLQASGKLTVEISGMGNVTVAGQSSSLEVRISGAGDYRGADLKTRQADAQVSGAGNATVWATDSLNARVSGAGDVNYYGSPKVNQSVSGLGTVTSKGNK